MLGTILERFEEVFRRQNRSRERLQSKKPTLKNSGFTMHKYGFSRFGPSKNECQSRKQREQIKVGFESSFWPTFAFLDRFWDPKCRPKLIQNVEKNEVENKMPKLCNDWYGEGRVCGMRGPVERI